jgi:hypothetical protein
LRATTFTGEIYDQVAAGRTAPHPRRPRARPVGTAAGRRATVEV